MGRSHRNRGKSSSSGLPVAADSASVGGAAGAGGCVGGGITAGEGISGLGY